MEPDLSLSSRLKRLLQSVWLMKMLNPSRPLRSSLASRVPLPSWSMSWKSCSREVCWARMMPLSLRMSCFSHRGRFLCLLSSRVLNSSRLSAFLPKASPVMRCIDITSWGSIASPSSILVNSSTLSLPTPLRSASLNLFSRLGGLSLSSSYRLMMASSSQRLFSSWPTTCSPDLARVSDFRKICPHFLRAAASLVLRVSISLSRSSFLERSSSTVRVSIWVASSPLERSASSWRREETSAMCLSISAYCWVFLVLSRRRSSSSLPQWASSALSPISCPSSLSTSARYPSSSPFRSSFSLALASSSPRTLPCECKFLTFSTGSLLNQLSPKKLWKASSDLPSTLGRGFSQGQRMLKVLIAASGPLVPRKDSQSYSRPSTSQAQLPVQMQGRLRCQWALMPDSCSFFIKTKNFSRTHVATWFTSRVKTWLYPLPSFDPSLLPPSFSFPTLLAFSFILDSLTIFLNSPRFSLYSLQSIPPLCSEQAVRIFLTFSLEARSIGVLL